MAAQTIITRTFGRVPVPRCPHCQCLTQQVKKQEEGKQSTYHTCPSCQQEFLHTPQPSLLPQSFEKFAQAVNMLIRRGSTLSAEQFSKESLHAVKRFYDHVSKDQQVQRTFSKLGFQSRVQRCAAQYAYFALREYKQREQLLPLLLPPLLEELQQKGITALQKTEFPSSVLLATC